MNIVYIGGGFVGACSAAVSADSGHTTLVFDIDPEKIKKLSTDDRDVIQSVIHEEGLADLLIRNRARITFTTDTKVMADCMHEIDAVVMCLPTPEKSGAAGESDLSFYERSVQTIGPLLAKRSNGTQEKRLVIVNKSTVPIRMIDYTKTVFADQGVKNFGIVSNPEFLVEGRAIKDSIHPDRVVVGAESPEDFEIMRTMYRRFYDSSTVTYIEVNPYEAAAGKLLANFLLFSKLALTYDVVGRVCEYVPQMRYEEVRKILISDPRIGAWGLYDSVYAGGSCFIKDAGSLAHQLEQAGTHAHLVRAVLEANTFQRDHFFGRAEQEAGFSWGNKHAVVFGLAFKQGTNDMRNAGAIGLIQQMIGAGAASITVYDPVAIQEAKHYFDPKRNELYARITYATSEEDALAHAPDVCVIATDWPQFRGIAELLLGQSERPLIMDGRRILHHRYDELCSAGFTIIAVGSPLLKRTH